MTTRTYSSVIAHTSDGTFRIWGLEFATQAGLCGLVQTADTGQINWVTVARPGTNTDAGYEIWRLPDSSLYFKIFYGTGGTATTPRIRLQVGSGSDGAGTLTGQLSTATSMVTNTAPLSTVTSYTSYLCVTNDFFGFLWKASGSSASAPKALGFAAVGKTVDSNGAATSLGYYVLHNNGSSSGNGPMYVQCVRLTATAATYTSATSSCVVPGLISTSPSTSLDASGNIQAYTHWGLFPTVLPLMYTCTCRESEVTELNTFSVAMVGSTSHTYLMIGSQVAIAEATGNTTTRHGCAMFYE